MPFDPYTLAGIIGAAIVIVAYFANQQGWLRSEDWRFPSANLVGSCLILVSLRSGWNLPTAVIEGFWAAISLYGMTRGWRRRPG
ncbi:MAG: CBU_0592 family membrane protein [Acetobacteraceae bacterium]